MRHVSNEQKLVDLCFSIALLLSDKGTDREGKPLTLHKMSVPKKAEWIAEQLRANGFPTVPCGSLWGVLVDKDGEFI